jgi:hypothetical protein
MKRILLYAFWHIQGTPTSSGASSLFQRLLLMLITLCYERFHGLTIFFYVAGVMIACLNWPEAALMVVA